MRIQLVNPYNRSALRQADNSLVDADGKSFPFTNGAWRFVDDDNYADNFGFQWNKFQKTQIDRYREGLKQSSDRFFEVTNWNKENLIDKNILEVGSGAGRFSRVVMEKTNGDLFSVDYSNAVEANFKNNGHHERLHLFQASVYDLPFAPSQFDKVFCFGVLQHTPDPKKSVKALIDMAKPGGEVIVDFYPVRGWYTKVHAKYLFRPVTKKMNKANLLKHIESNVDGLIRAYHFFDTIGVGRVVNRFLPICDIKTTIPKGLDKNTLREWAILDTFDMFSPQYDQPQRLKDVINWFEEFGMINVVGKELRYEGNNSVTFVRGYRQ